MMFLTMFALPLTRVPFDLYFLFLIFIQLSYLPTPCCYLITACDPDIRCGQWYDVGVSNNEVTLEKRTDLLQRAEVRICAFDIETTKLPLKFPDADYDLVMMISYMVDGQGYLIINREVRVNGRHSCFTYLSLSFTLLFCYKGHYQILVLSKAFLSLGFSFFS